YPEQHGKEPGGVEEAFRCQERSGVRRPAERLYALPDRPGSRWLCEADRTHRPGRQRGFPAAAGALPAERGKGFEAGCLTASFFFLPRKARRLVPPGLFLCAPGSWRCADLLSFRAELAGPGKALPGSARSYLGGIRSLARGGPCGCHGAALSGQPLVPKHVHPISLLWSDALGEGKLRGVHNSIRFFVLT